MADAADRAQDYQQRDLARALRHRRSTKPALVTRCTRCLGRNDRPEYAICTDCLDETVAGIPAGGGR